MEEQRKKLEKLGDLEVSDAEISKLVKIFENDKTIDGLNPRYRKFPPIYRGDIAYIPLFNADMKVTMYAKSTIKEFIEHYCKFTYYAIPHHSTPGKFYASSNENVLMHHIIKGKPTPGMVGDHENGDSLDNRADNIRHISNSANIQNIAKKEGLTSKYKGVCLDQGRWAVAIQKDKDHKYLGRYDTEIEGAKVYDAYAVLYFGIDAYTNELLTYEEKLKIVKDQAVPDNLLFVPSKKIYKEISPCIKLKDDGLYHLRIRRKKLEDVPKEGEKVVMKYVKQTYDTLESAELGRYAYECENAHIDKIRQTNDAIVRNEEGHATYVTYTKPKNGPRERLFALINDEIYYHILSINWSRTSKFYLSNRRLGSMHAYIWQLYHKRPIPKGMIVDHINKNTNDNRICNLRLVDASLSAHNKTIKEGRVDKYRGIQVEGNKFRVDVEALGRPNGFRYEYFETAEQAAARVNEVNLKIYGAAASLNEIDYSVETRVTDRIAKEDITEARVQKVKTVYDLYNIIKITGIQAKMGITSKTIKRPELEKYKAQVIQILFYTNTNTTRTSGDNNNNI